MITLNQNDWIKISSDLEDHHALFYEMWQLGRPNFTDDIPTAAVGFSKDGEFLDFFFNPEYWSALTPYERLFVISHECLHVILNHGLRTTLHEDHPRINFALDIVVNHLLVNAFGFERNRIRDEDTLCWTDTVFKDDPDLANIPTNESYEYYYQKIPESLKVEVFTVDDHSKLGSNAEKIIGKLNERLSNEEKETLKDVVEKHYEDSSRGDGQGGWMFVDNKPVAIKRKWETVIHKWSLKYLKEGLDENDQWARIARRFEILPSDIFLPSEMEDDAKDFDRIPVHLYLDTSGSCVQYKNRFFRAALSLPKDRFLVKLFCFDTKVKETELTSKKIYGGGGTDFDIIEGNIQKVIKADNTKYPEAVFIISDGHGTDVNPEYPERWHWFLTNRGSRRYIHGKSKTYKLDDYE
jgi:predicted metal-dependent peptidase